MAQIKTRTDLVFICAICAICGSFGLGHFASTGYTAAPKEGCRMDANATPRVVLVHDWLTGMRGGEKCLDVLCRRWPHAQLFTLLHKPGSVSPAIEQLAPQTSALQYLP